MLLGVSWLWLLLAASGCSWLLLAAPGCLWVLLGAPVSWVALGDPQNPILKAVKNYRRYYDSLLSKNGIWSAFVARGSFGHFLVGCVLGGFWMLHTDADADTDTDTDTDTDPD